VDYEFNRIVYVCMLNTYHGGNDGVRVLVSLFVASPRLASAAQGEIELHCSSTHDDPGCQMARRMSTANLCSPCCHLMFPEPRKGIVRTRSLKSLLLYFTNPVT
jgi:hypothetical protein